jgi:predicted kinase
MQKNAANFEDLISFCTGYGTAYNPSKAAIQISSLQALRTTAQNDLTNLTTLNSVFINATNARQAAFNPLKALAT